MPIRTGAAYLESLRDDRQIWIDGDRVADVTRDPRFTAAAQTVAELYQMQHDPALHATMTYASPTSGDAVGVSFIQPASVDDLVRRRAMVKVWADATCGMFGRSPDYMNVMTAATPPPATRSATASAASPTTSVPTTNSPARTTSR